MSDEDWIGACRQLEANRRNVAGPNRAYTRKNTHIFAGLLTCGYCGDNMGATFDRQRFVDYEGFIKSADPKIVRKFITSVIQNFCIQDGKILSITFKNGIEHRFIYKQPEA